MSEQKKSRNLFDIADDIYQLTNVFFEDLPEEDFKETVQAFEDEFKDKADQIALVLKERQADIKTIDEEIKRLQKKKKHYERGVDRLKTYIVQAMKRSGLNKFKTALNSFSVRNNRRVMFENEETFIKEHPEYVKEKVTYTISKADVKKDLQDGKEIGGAFIEINPTPSIR